MGWADAPTVSGSEKWKSAPTYQQADDAEYLRQRLEALEKSGKLRPAEAETLAKLRAEQPTNAAAVGGGNAEYLAFLNSALINGRDEVVDFFGGNGDAIRAADKAAQEAYPKEYAQGDVAGSFASSILPGLGAAKILKGVGPAYKTLGYALTGAFNGGLSSFMDGNNASGFTGPDLTARLQEGRPGAIVGGAVGAAAPWVGAGTGALARLMANRARAAEGLSAKAVRVVRQPVADAQAAAGDIRSYLQGLGPEAMIADVPGPLQSQAMGLATMQGRGGAEISRAVNQRALAAGPRIETTLNDSITGPNAAFDARRALATERTNVLGPEYEAALKSPDFRDTSPVLRAMDPNAVGAPSAAYAEVRRNLGLPDSAAGPFTPVAPAPLLHNARSELSDKISEATRAGKGGFVANTKPVLGALDEILNTIPGYKAARTGYANNKAMDRAIEMGQEALRGGRVSAASPAEFSAAFSKLSDAEKDAFRTGMRRDIAGLMGTSKNAPAAAWGEFAKSWNEEKLRAALGADAEPIIQRLKAEHVFSETRGRIDQGSMTARRTEATKGLDAANPEARAVDRGFLTGTMNLLQKKVVDPITFGSRRSELNTELGKFYTAKGDEAQRLIAELLKQTKVKGGKFEALAELFGRYITMGGAAVAPQYLRR